jgi:alpha-1,6-mannosyltransferase
MPFGPGAPERIAAVRLVACGAVLTACVVAWAVLGDVTARVHVHLALYALAFAAYVAALRVARGLSSRGLQLALAAAIAWRLALAFAPPLLSDDVYRSVWEGRVQVHGHNPYEWRNRPESDRLAHLRDEVWRRVNHKEYTAIYPPLWQLAARGVSAVHDSVTAMKLFLVCCELLALAALGALLRRRGQPRERVLVMAWSPLAIVEVAGCGHNDVFAIAFLVLSLLWLDEGRPLRSALAAALGAQAKVLPGLVAASWARRYRFVHVLAAVLLALALFLPYRWAGPGLWMSLGKYGQFWRFNESVFALLDALTGSHEHAVRLGLVLLGMLALALAVRRVDATTAGLAVVAGWLLLTPNVLPSYAVWLLPWLVLRDAPPLLLFTATVQLAYLVYPAWLDGAPWKIGWGVRAIEYLPCLALAVAGAARARARRASAGLDLPAWHRTS